MATSETSAESNAEAIPSKVAPRVSIVVPAFNEAVRIGESLRKIEAFLAQMPWRAEVLVVDDGSQDDTPHVVGKVQFPGLRLLRSDANHGKGYSVRSGVLAASGEYVMFTDADLSAPIEELQKLLAAVEEHRADVVVGSRAIDRSMIEKHQSRGRELGGIVYNIMVRALLGLRIHDTQCGFKLFKRSRIVPVFEKMTISGFGFDPELLFLASRSGLRIVEIPVRWSHAEGSKIRFLKDSIRMFMDLIRIRWNQITGRYS
jgi:glycosyltransferase involved in cell wall biosynthesis